MPNLNDFLEEPKKKLNPDMEELNGIRPCSKCDEDVEGALWDPNEMTMYWECSNKHENVYRVG